MRALNACPACGAPLSLRQIAMGPEKFAIRCRTCGARLWKRTRTFWFITLSVAATIRISNEFGVFSWQWALGFAVTAAVTTLLAWVTVRVRLAPDDMEDPPSLALPEYDVPDAPPPPDPTFRGMSGPPPRPDDPTTDR